MNVNLSSVNISYNCVDLIRSILPEGSTILELGSGAGTLVLSQYYKMYSVENQPEWFDKYPEATTYINCRSKMYDATYPAPEIPGNLGWYHPDDIFPNLPEHYDLILIDGPGGGKWGRGGFYKHLDKFNTDVPLVFDDIDRAPEMILMKEVAKKLNRECFVLENDSHIGIIK
jgi:hypothetical protein